MLSRFYNISLFLCCAFMSFEANARTPIKPSQIPLAEGDSWVALSIPEDSIHKKKLEITDSEKTILKAQNDFAFSLYRIISGLDEKENENTLLSPLSLSLNLGMLINGATGKAAKDLRKMTGLGTKYTIKDLNDLNRSLIEGLCSADSSLKLSLANSIWLDETLKVTESFVDSVTVNYYSSLYRRPLYTVETMNEINDWVSGKTNGVIDHIFRQPLIKPMRMILVNALYFYGAWEEAFSRRETKKASFNSITGKKSEVDMMHSKLISYSQCETFTAFYLPVGNGAYKFTLILPDEGVKLMDVEKALNSELLQRLSTEEKMFCKIKLPRFEISSQYKLKKPLEKMGYKSIFTDSDNNFNLIVPDDPLLLGDINQKTLIRVDEDGAEGAAVTYTAMVSSTMIEKTYPEFVLDRPFLFIVSETSTGAVLFVGDVKKL